MNSDGKAMSLLKNCLKIAKLQNYSVKMRESKEKIQNERTLICFSKLDRLYFSVSLIFAKSFLFLYIPEQKTTSLTEDW